MGADLEGFLHGAHGGRGAHGHCRDAVSCSVTAKLLGELERGLECVFIELREDALGALGGLVLTVDMTVELRVGHVLDQHRDMQSRRSGLIHW